MAHAVTVKKKAAAPIALTEEEKALDALYGDNNYEDTVRVQGGQFPMLKVLQALSPPVSEDGLKVGSFYHTIAKEAFSGPLTLIPILLADTYAIWEERKHGGGLIARSVDGVTWDKPNYEFSFKGDLSRKFNTGKNVATSGLTEWRDGNKPVADRTIVLFALMKDHPEYGPVRLFFRSSALKEGTTFTQQLQAKRNRIVNGVVKSRPPFAFQVDINTVAEKNDKGTFFVPKLTNLRPLDIVGNDKDIAESVKVLYDTGKERFRQAIVTDNDQEAEEHAPAINPDY